MTVDPIVDALVRASEREFQDAVTRVRDADSVIVEAADGAWKQKAHALPAEVNKLLRTIDLPSLRVQALGAIEETLFGWQDRRNSRRALDIATVRAAWRRSLVGLQRSETLRVVRLAVDDAKHLAQIQKLQAHECASALPKWQEEPAVQHGVLHVRDVRRGTATFGVRSYPEATPVEVVVYTVRQWTSSTGKTKPRCWDLTAGSGTVFDVITTVFGGRVVGTDIAIDNAATIYGDLRDAGQHSRHRRAPKFFPGDEVPVDVIRRPDLVFVHPPSRGWPACAWIYGRDRVPSLTRDVGVLLERAQYVEVIADAARVALAQLADGGLMSVLVPEYVRCHQEISADPGTADALLAAIADVATLIERHTVVDDAPVRQASLGTTRGPVEHLILAKKLVSA